MTLEERVAWLEGVIDKLMALMDVSNGNISTPGNVSMVGPRDPGNPTKLFMGPDVDRGGYFFSQERFPGQGTPYWFGFETFERIDPANPSWGYGYWPLRVWGLNFILEANGDQVGRNIVAEKIYLQSPAHRNMTTGKFEKPDHYDEFGVPFTAAGEQMGGIYYDAGDLSTYITREGAEVVLYNNDHRTVLG